MYYKRMPIRLDRIPSERRHARPLRCDRVAGHLKEGPHADDHDHSIPIRKLQADKGTAFALAVAHTVHQARRRLH